MTKKFFIKFLIKLSGLKFKIFKPYNKIQIYVIKIFEMHTPHNKIHIYVIKIFEMTHPHKSL